MRMLLIKYLKNLHTDKNIEDTIKIIKYFKKNSKMIIAISN